MSRSADLHVYNYDGLLAALVMRGLTEQKEAALRVILDKCGMFLGEHYIIMSNEYVEDFDPWTVAASMIDRCCGVDDSFDALVGGYDGPGAYHRWMEGAVEESDIEDALRAAGIDVPEVADDEEGA